MKVRKIAGLLAVAVVMCSGVVGCKKNLQKVTPLPPQGGGLPGEATGGKVGEGLTGTEGPGTTSGDLGTNVAGIPLPKSFADWIPDRLIFQEQTVYFDFDKSNVRPSEVPKLETVAKRMEAFPNNALRIEGHCDERGTEGYNQALGERRALSVREYLVKLGIDPARIETISFGEDRPVDPGHTEAAWSKNRRGEIVLLSPPGGATGATSEVAPTGATP